MEGFYKDSQERGPKPAFALLLLLLLPYYRKLKKHSINAVFEKSR